MLNRWTDGLTTSFHKFELLFNQASEYKFPLFFYHLLELLIFVKKKHS